MQISRQETIVNTAPNAKSKTAGEIGLEFASRIPYVMLPPRRRETANAKNRFDSCFNFIFLDSFLNLLIAC